MLVKFVKEVLRFIKEVDNIKPQNCLVILDNESIFRSSITEEINITVDFSVNFILQYTPEIAPIERYFSKLKKTVINKARGKHIN